MKAALISGSSSGIGKAIAEKFLRNGIKVVGLARDHSKFTPNEKHYIPICLLYTSPSPRDLAQSRMPSSA